MFFGIVAAYFAGTTAYSFYLKRLLLIDVVTLAGLYTIRVIGGAAAIAVPTSEWLLAFSMFIFLSLALIKRYSELALRLDADLPDPVNRNYRVNDLPVIASLAAAAGFCAVIVLSLYLSSETVHALYTHPSILWLACPIFLYWISRMLMLSHRRLVSEDPILFTMKDKVSWAAGAAIVVLGVLAA
jgi:4-hydroxybenzoate polyprenyltransferase